MIKDRHLDLDDLTEITLSKNMMMMMICCLCCCLCCCLFLFMPRWNPAYLFEIVFVKCVCIWRTSVFFQFYGVLSGIIYNYSPLPPPPPLFIIIQSHTFAAENCAIGNIVKLKKKWEVLCRINVAMWVLLI